MLFKISVLKIGISKTDNQNGNVLKWDGEEGIDKAEMCLNVSKNF